MTNDNLPEQNTEVAENDNGNTEILQEEDDPDEYITLRDIKIT